MKNAIKLSVLLALIIFTASCKKEEMAAPVAGLKKVTYRVNTNFKYIAVKYLNGQNLREEEVMVKDGQWTHTFNAAKNDSVSLYAFGIQSNAGYGSHIEVIIMMDGKTIARNEQNVDPECDILLPNLEAEVRSVVLD